MEIMSENNQNKQPAKDINEASVAIRANVTDEMEVIKNHRDYQTRMHKDPLVEANYYLATNDVYELFKVCDRLMFQILLLYLNMIFFKNLTVNLVLKKPRDPIRNMIDKLKEVHEAEEARKAIKSRIIFLWI
jgi:hypothetical protein